MELELLPLSFTVCKNMPPEDIPRNAAFLFLARTDGELSLVCPTELAPPSCAKREDGWRAFRVVGQLDFSLIGVLAGIADTLARAGVSIFAVSTYDTDYVLLQETALEVACAALENEGYILI